MTTSASRGILSPQLILTKHFPNKREEQLSPELLAAVGIDKGGGSDDDDDDEERYRRNFTNNNDTEMVKLSSLIDSPMSGCHCGPDDVDNDVRELPVGGANVVSPDFIGDDIDNENDDTDVSSSWSIGLLGSSRGSALLSPAVSTTSTSSERPSRPPPIQGGVCHYDQRHDPMTFPPSGNYTSITRNNTTSTSCQQSSVRGSRGVRCYRLNLERPFDLHAEQSPLEYGDYMAPWPVEVRPRTVGPVEYCPPRHLGGWTVVWRELLRWNRERIYDRKNGEEEEEKKKTNNLDSLEGEEEGGKWRIISASETDWVKGLGERDANGEYLFRTYDLSHVASKPYMIMNDLVGNLSFASLDSDASEEERRHPKSLETMADETARLFRRSELSLREKSELDEKEEETATLAVAVAIAGAHASISTGSERSIGASVETTANTKKKSSMSKKLFRSMSKAIDNMQGTPISSSTTGGGLGNSMGQLTTKVRQGSMQALTIEKARDLVDEGNGGGENVNGIDDEDAEGKKKAINVSLYIMGEYDILNDLVNDGARRLRDNRNVTDLELLRQNKPCPPPDRWVRCTGWGKCNPSSMYAKHPPPDFDWVRYYDKLRLITSPAKRGNRRRLKDVVDGAAVNAGVDNSENARPQDRKASVDALESTELTAPIALSTSDLSQDEYQQVNGRLIKVMRAGSGSRGAVSTVTKPLAVVTKAGGNSSAGSHFNKPLVVRSATETPLSKSAGSTRTKAMPRAATYNLGASLPSASLALKPKKGLVRRMSSIMGGKKK